MVLRFFSYILLFVMICSCKKDINDGLTSLVNIINESAGENCSSGGYKIETGIDKNENGVLDYNEVQNSEYICHGDDGIKIISDYIIRIPFQLEFAWRSAGITWTGALQDEILFGFNIDDYVNIDSIIFIAQFDRVPPETTDSLFLRLYDYTNDISIANSELWSTITNSQFESNPNLRVFKTNNIVESFLDERINLGIQFRKQLNIIEERSISIHSAEILLFREK